MQIVVGNGEELLELSRRPRLAQYISDTAKRSTFIWAQAKAQANRQTKNYRLWRVWLVVNPFLDVLLYAFLFGFLLKTSRGIPNFVGYVILGVIYMRMMTGLVLRGSMLLPQSRGLVTAFDFPRSCIVLAQLVRHMLENLTAGLVGVVTALAFQFPEVHVTGILILPLFVLLHIFGGGLAFITARATAVIPELDPLIRVGSQAWFFLSGVMYTVDRFSGHPTIHAIMSANPAYVFLESIRDVTLYGEVPEPSTWAYLFLWSAGIFVLGFVYFWRAENRYVRLV